MTANQVLAQASVLRDLILLGYQQEKNLLKMVMKPKSREWGNVQRVQMGLGKVFAGTKKGRDLRLRTLAALMPILEHDGRPVFFKSLKSLNAAEFYAIFEWLKGPEPLTDNMDALNVLYTVAQDTEMWAEKIRKAQGYIKRPLSTLEVPPDIGEDVDARQGGLPW